MRAAPCPSRLPMRWDTGRRAGRRAGGPAGRGRSLALHLSLPQCQCLRPVPLPSPTHWPPRRPTHRPFPMPTRSTSRPTPRPTTGGDAPSPSLALPLSPVQALPLPSAPAHMPVPMRASRPIPPHQLPPHHSGLRHRRRTQRYRDSHKRRRRPLSCTSRSTTRPSPTGGNHLPWGRTVEVEAGTKQLGTAAARRLVREATTRPSPRTLR